MSNIRVKVKSRDASQARLLPASAIEELSWNDDRYGGFSSGSINAVRSELADINVRPGDQVEIFDGTTRLYRGYVRRENLISRTSKNISYQLAGISQILGKSPVKKRIAGGQDISTTAAALIHDTINTAPVLWPLLGVQASLLGITSDGADYVGQEMGNAISGLVSQAANRAVWGGDVGVNGEDIIFIEPLSSLLSPDHVITSPSSVISEASRDLSYEDIVNAVVLESDIAPRYPNLIYNSGFEKPTLSGAGGANLVRNGDFELGTDSWDFSGGASIWPGSGRMGAAFSGDKFADIDSGDEIVLYDDTPASALTAGKTYRFSFRAKRQTAYVVTPTYSMVYTLGFTNSGGVLIGDTITEQLKDDGGDVFNSVQWTRFEWQGVCPAGGVGIYLKFDGEDGLDGGAGDAIFIDAVDVIDVSAIYQDGWEIVTNGTSSVTSVDWASGGAHEGGYCVSIEAQADDNDDDQVYLVQKGGAKYSIVPGQALTYTVKLKGQAGVTSPKVRLYTEIWSTNLGSLGIFHQDISAGSLTGEWQNFYLSIGTNNSSAYGLSWLAIRGDGRIFVDSMRASDTNFEDEPEGITAYLPDGNYISETFYANVLFGSGGAGGDNSSPGDEFYSVYNSQAENGLRLQRVRVSGINNSTSAQDYAIAYLKTAAAALPGVNVTIHEPTRVFKPGQSVLVSGKDGKELSSGALHIARCSYTFSASAGLSLSMQLSREKRDEAFLITELIRRNAARGQGGSSGSTGAAAPSSAGGGSTAGVSYWGSSARTSSDPTLHDSYLPSGGPHITPAERSALSDVTSEVIAARGSYGSLGARLDDMGGGGAGIDDTISSILTEWDGSEWVILFESSTGKVMWD